MSFRKKNTNVKKSVRDYALFCTFRHALRRHPVFASGRSGLVLLNAPEGYSPKAYSSTILAELYPDDDFRRGDAGFMFIGVDDKPSKVVGEYEDDCQNKARAIILVEHGAAVPQEAILGADVIVDILPISFRDVRAACHVVLGMKLSEEEAQRILEFPLDQVWAALRRGRPVSEVIRRLSEVVVQQDLPAPKKPERAVPPLSEMHGYGDAKEWGISLARDISDWRNGHIAWDDIDKGVVLSGPPGVGKSIYAKAVAKECEVSLIATSLGQWQSRGHLGDLLRAMRADFAAAKDAAPAILFIDEIDSIGNREKFTHDHKDYSVQVVNAFLECLDGLDSREGVVVVGATNNITRIDPAVLRAGRLDQHIEIPLPDGASRVAILSQHIDGIITIEGLQPLRAATVGMTGADLAKVARDARRLARREKRALTVDDLRAALPEVIKIEGDYRRSIAVHEAGHTVVGNELKHGTYLGTRIFRLLPVVIDDVLPVVHDTLANLRITALQRLRITTAQTHEQNLLGRERKIVATGRLELEARFREGVRHFGGRVVDGVEDLVEHRALGRLPDFQIFALFLCRDRTDVLSHVFSIAGGWQAPLYVRTNWLPIEFLSGAIS